MRAIPVGTLALLAACGIGAPAAGPGSTANPGSGPPADPQDTTHVVATMTGFEGPEAVRFDPEQDVWFVANFGPGGEDPRDANGYISRVRADGRVEARRFMAGTSAAPLHMPRGMFIAGDTLWVADVDGVHGFHRRDGRHLAFIDFRAHEPGFLNDVAVGPEGALYVTDTGRARVYRVAGAGGRPEVLADSLPGSINGITRDDARGVLLLAPWGDVRVLRALTPAGRVDSVLTLPAGRADGIEPLADGILVATQTDSSLWVVSATGPRRVVRTRGRPADIGWDGGRRRVAVPYIALNRVDVWELP